MSFGFIKSTSESSRDVFMDETGGRLSMNDVAKLIIKHDDPIIAAQQARDIILEKSDIRISTRISSLSSIVKMLLDNSDDITSTIKCAKALVIPEYYSFENLVNRADDKDTSNVPSLTDIVDVMIYVSARQNELSAMKRPIITFIESDRAAELLNWAQYHISLTRSLNPSANHVLVNMRKIINPLAVRDLRTIGLQYSTKEQ